MSALSSHPRPRGLFPPFPDISHPVFILCLVLLILTKSHCREQKGGRGLEKWKSGLRDTPGKPPSVEWSPSPERSGGTCAHPSVHWEGAESHPGTDLCPHSGWSTEGSRAWRAKENNPWELAWKVYHDLGTAPRAVPGAPHKLYLWC